MIKKIIFLVLIVTIVYIFYNPIVIQLKDFENTSKSTFKPNQIFKLKEILNLQDVQNARIYLVLNNEERKYFSLEIPKWKVLKTQDVTLIKDLLNCEFRYTDSDVSTIQSKIYIYTGDKLVFESEISLEKNHLGLQNTYTGWASTINNSEFLKIISKFDRYNQPFLIIK